MRMLASYSSPMSAIRTKALRRLVESDHRIEAFTIEDDGVFIYTNTAEWDDGNGAGTFRGDSETAAVRYFLRTVTRNDSGRI